MSNNNTEGALCSFCLMCGKRLKEFKNEKRELSYHKKCFNILLKDIKNFEKVAEKKYAYVKLYSGKTKEEFEQSKDPILLHFD